jgi:membrane protein required for colicin V production
MNIADWIILIVILLSIMGAIKDGFFHELISLAGVVVGYLLAVWNYPRGAALWSRFLHSRGAAEMAGFLTIFLAVVLVAAVVAALVRRALREVGLSWFDRLLGIPFGLIRGALVVAIGLVVWATFSPGSSTLANSRYSPYLLSVGRGIIWAAPGEIRTRFWSGLEKLDRARHGHPPLAPGKIGTRRAGEIRSTLA